MGAYTNPCHMMQETLGMDEHLLQQVQLALAQAKRVRRESNISVKQLAQLRDYLQPMEAQGKNEQSNTSSMEKG